MGISKPIKPELCAQAFSYLYLPVLKCVDSLAMGCDNVRQNKGKLNACLDEITLVAIVMNALYSPL